MQTHREFIADLGDGYSEWGAEVDGHLVIWVEHGERVSPLYDIELDTNLEQQTPCSPCNCVNAAGRRSARH